VTGRVLTAAECTWSAGADGAWLQVQPTSGQGESLLTLQVAANPDARPRTSVLQVNGVRVTLVQEAASPSQAPQQPPATAPAPVPTPLPGPNAKKVKFEGRVSDLSGACPALSFQADGFRVITDAATRFTEGTCRDVRNGRDVEGDGELRQGVVYATKIEVDD
jgi:hypothetical protein